MKIKVLITLYTLLAFIRIGHAQVNYNSIKYTQKNGLFTSNIKTIAQDRFGFIWIGSQDGLYFFNGVDFKIIHSSNSANETHDVKQILYDSVFDCVWVAYSSGGLEAFDCSTHRLKHNVVFVENGKEKMIENINFVLHASNKQMILGLSNGLLAFSPDKSAVQCKVDITNLVPVGEISYLGVFENRIFAFILGKGLFTYNSKTKRTDSCIYKSSIKSSANYFDGINFFFSSNGAITKYNLYTGENDNRNGFKHY